MPTKNPLPQKENAIFKRILKCYEQKQYKNGLKFCKQILTNSKFTDHGETLAMKGLTLNCMGRKEEAYDFVRKGLRNDLTSHVCWHVYGLLQRSDRKYDEAIKCYRNALKWDKDNLQILRDLSLLQIQMRDVEGYKETRYQLLVLRPAQRASWIGYAMGFHLLKDYDMALEVLEEFRKTTLPKPFDYEHCEMLLYQNMILVESGQYQRALDHLDEHEKQIVDKLALQETRGKIMLKLGRMKVAEIIYWDLLDRNPDNHAYYKALEDSIQPATVEARLEIYKHAEAIHPRAICPKRLPMNFLSGEAFRLYADTLLKASIRKGMQPLFTIIKELYKDSEKVKILGDLVVGYEKNLKECKRFTPCDTGDGPTEDPTTELYTWFYLAQHYDYLREYTKAMEYIDKCLDHTVLFIEAHAIKGQIYKHAGDMQSAVQHLEETQSLDTADRCMNCWCARYMLHANMVKEAEAMCSKFTREGVSAMENLNEMQCFWFQVGCARAYQRLGRYGEALKKCHEISRHFTEIVEDQFDFHTYCMRKMTLRAYVELLRLEDVIRSHKFYYNAAKLAIEIYLKLHDQPLKDGDDEDDVDQENLSPAELKKLKNKQRKKARKDALKKEKEKQEEHKVPQKPKNPDADPDAPKEEELIPDKLARPENPLEEAIYFLKPLQMLAGSKIDTHVMAFQIYYRKNKLLLMLQSIKRGYAIDPDHPGLHQCLVKFLRKVQEMKSGVLASPMQEVLTREMSSIFGQTRDPNELNNQVLKTNQSQAHQFAGARMMYFLDPSTAEKAISIATSLSTENVMHELCSEVFDCLKQGQLGTCTDSVLEDYKAACHHRFPLAAAFLDRPPPVANDVSETNSSTNPDSCSGGVESGLPNGDASS